MSNITSFVLFALATLPLAAQDARATAQRNLSNIVLRTGNGAPHALMVALLDEGGLQGFGLSA